jgi:hypothetical protein
MFDSSMVSTQSYDCPALIFYRVSTAPDEPWVNRLAAYLTGSGGMSHVELRFTTGESLSVYQDETVFLRRRGYSNNQYVIMPLSGVSRVGEQQMRKFALEQVGKRFNGWGMRRAALPWFLHRGMDGTEPEGKWFCSELVTATLQQSSYLSGLVPNSVSPNALYTIACQGRSYAGEYGALSNPLNAAVGMNTLAFHTRQSGLDLRCFGAPVPAAVGARPQPATARVAHVQSNGVLVVPGLGRRP